MDLNKELDAEVNGTKDEALSALAKSVLALVKSHRGQVDPAAPRHVDEGGEADRSVRWEGTSGEPRDTEDEHAQAAAERRVEHANKARREDNGEDEEEKSRRHREGEKMFESRQDEGDDGEDERRTDKSLHDETCKCAECMKARKSRKGHEDAAERAIDESQRAYIYDDDWNKDDEDLHGHFEDPAEEDAPGSGDDKTIITNMGRRVRSSADAKEGRKKSLREAFYRDIAKSKETAAIVDASDALAHLTDVLGAHLDGVQGLIKSLNERLDQVEKVQKAQSGVLVEMAKSRDSEVANQPMAGIGMFPAVTKSNATAKTEKAPISDNIIRKALYNGMVRGIVSPDAVAEFDAFRMQNYSAREWVESTLTPEQITALNIPVE